MRQQQWRMLGLGLGAVFVMCVAHTLNAAAGDDIAAEPSARSSPRDFERSSERPKVRVKVTAGPAQAKDKSPADPAYDASKSRFDAWPLTDRKAIQDALLWVADYQGSVDGTFGKRSRDALVAFERRSGLNTDAIVDEGEYKRLVEAARRAKELVRFTIVRDATSGMRLGIPMKLLPKRGKVPGGTRFFAAEDGFAVETQAIPAGDTELGQLYERLRRDGAERRVTYKASKPDWFVVSGEATDTHFYTRFDRKPGTDGGELRGYTITYPTRDAKRNDRYALAIAGSAEPFPEAAVPPKVAAKDATPSNAGGLAAPRLDATGVAVAPDRVLSVLPAGCTDPKRGNDPMKVVASDAPSGLTLLELPGAVALPAAALTGARGPLGDVAELVIVGFSIGGDGRPALAITAGEAFSRQGAASGEREWRVYAPLQRGAQGSAVFDRAGTLQGVIGRTSLKPRLVAGIVPQASYLLLDGTTTAGILQRAQAEKPQLSAVKTAPKNDSTAGAIARMAGASVVAIDCSR